jgi:hypothetical protein
MPQALEHGAEGADGSDEEGAGDRREARPIKAYDAEQQALRSAFIRATQARSTGCIRGPAHLLRLPSVRHAPALAELGK